MLCVRQTYGDVEENEGCIAPFSPHLGYSTEDLEYAGLARLPPNREPSTSTAVGADYRHLYFSNPMLIHVSSDSELRVLTRPGALIPAGALCAEV